MGLFGRQPKEEPKPVSTGTAFRDLLTFQLKLALDALRDFALSPISIVAFIIDSIRKPDQKDSLYEKLMRLGRRSDQVINLFNEYDDHSHYTVDQTLADVEAAVAREIEKERAREQGEPRRKKLSSDGASRRFGKSE